MIAPILHLNAINVIKEIPTTGHSPLLVIAENYSKYFVKSAQNQSPCTYLINEFLCHYFLKLWNIPTPDIAVIKVKPTLLPENLSKINKKFYYEKIAFGSKTVDNAIDMNEFISIAKKSEYRRIYNPTDIILLGLFDIWVENDDRRPTNNNVIFGSESGRLKLMAIDHAFTFSSHKHEELNPSFVSSSYNETILLTPLAQSVRKKLVKDQDWFRQIEENFYFCVSNCEHYFDEICNNLPETLGFDLRLQNIVRNFLFNIERNKLVFKEFVIRVKEK